MVWVFFQCSPWIRRRRRRNAALRCKKNCRRRRRSSWSMSKGFYTASNWRKTTGCWPVSILMFMPVTLLLCICIVFHNAVHPYIQLLIQLQMLTDRIHKERDHNKVPAALSLPSLYLLFHRRCILCPLCRAGSPAEDTQLLHPPVLWQGKTLKYIHTQSLIRLRWWLLIKLHFYSSLVKATKCFRRKK